MQGTMKCAIYYGPKDVKMEERPIPQITENDVLVKILRAGICGSDLTAWNYGGEPTGVFPGNPFGHEMVGKIVEKGAKVGKDINVGDIVFVEPLKSTKAGTIMADMLGGFGEYVKVENAKSHHNIYVLPKDVDLDSAALIEPFSVGAKGAICMNASKDENVVVLGAGPIGLSAAATLVARGLKNVVVVDRVDWRLDIAKELGAKTINTATEDLQSKLLEIFGEAPQHAIDFSAVDPKLLQQIFAYTQKVGMNFSAKTPNVDLVVDAAGAMPLLSQFIANSKHGTKFSIVAVYKNNIEIPGASFVMNEPCFRGSQGYDRETIEEVIGYIVNKKVDAKKMVTAKYKHADFVEAITAAANPDKNVKVLIEYAD